MDIIDARVLDHKLMFCACLDLLARTEPFSKFEAGRLIRSVQTQMENNTCLFIIEGERLNGISDGWSHRTRLLNLGGAAILDLDRRSQRKPLS